MKKFVVVIASLFLLCSPAFGQSSSLDSDSVNSTNGSETNVIKSLSSSLTTKIDNFGDAAEDRYWSCMTGCYEIMPLDEYGRIIDVISAFACFDFCCAIHPVGCYQAGRPPR